MTALMLASVALLLQVQTSPSHSTTPTFFVFLEAGKTPEPTDKVERKRLMGLHLGNFLRLLELGDLCAAGPLRDDTKVKEGIVVLTVPNSKAVEMSFLPDELAKTGVLHIHAIPISVKYGKFNMAALDRTKMEEDRLVTFASGKVKSTKSDREVHKSRIRDAKGTMLAFYASTTNRDPIREIALFRGKDEAAIKAWLDGDSLVKSGALVPTFYPQYLGKGLLDE